MDLKGISQRTDSQLSYHDKLVWQVRDEMMKKAAESQRIDPWFLPGHLLIVEKCASWLCDIFPQADRDVVGLAVWFHDSARLDGIEKDHDTEGATIAQKRLTELSFDEAKKNMVIAACRSHSADEIKPEGLEAKILAAADAMSHFIGGLYLRLVAKKTESMGFEAAIKHLGHKLERDFHQKIDFDEAKIMVKPVYDSLKLLFESVES